MKKIQQSGFALVEGLLVIIAVTLVIFTGYYVYNTRHHVSTAAGTVIPKSKATNHPQRQYLLIKELGIEVPVSSQLKGLDYQINPAYDTMALIATKKFEQAVGNCQSPNTASSSFPTIGSVTRIPGKYDPNAPPSNFFSEFIKQFPDFYITYGQADGGPSLLCTDNDQAKTKTVVNLFNQTVPALKEAVKNAQQI